MKAFFIKLGIFILPIVFISLPLDHFISKHAKQSNSCSGELLVWNDIYSSMINTDIAIYGSSKAWVGIDPHIFEDSLNCTSYNFGIDGHNFWLQYLRHIELLKFNKKPGYIILNLDMFSLEKKKELYNLDQFLPFMLFNKNIYTYTSSYEGFSYFDYHIPLVRFAGKRETMLNAIIGFLNIVSYSPMRKKGYKGMESVWNNDFEKAKSKYEKYEVEIDPDTEKLLNEFFSECKEQNIKVILVYSPEHVEFQEFIKNRNEIISIYEEYSSKYNIPFLDYSDNFLCKEKHFFYNSTHLNKTGSEIFTSLLAKDLKAIIPS